MNYQQRGENSVTGTWLTIIPPILAIAFAILTRKVYLSLFIGILSGALIINSFSIKNGLIEMFQTIWLVVSDVEWNVPILVFVLLLGGLTSLLANSGATERFSLWALSRVKTRESAQFVTVFTGIAIFIDDYFNSLAVGQIARPLTDAHGVSRSKLAYLIDSTGAPICILIPLSSWGAYVFSLLVHPINEYNLGIEPFTAFLMIVPANYYAIMALLIVFLTIYWKIDFREMRKHEQAAMDNIDYSLQKKAQENIVPFKHAFDLMLPILTLVISTITFFLLSGNYFSSNVSIIEATGDGNIVTSLVYGGLLAILVTAIMYIPSKKLNISSFFLAFFNGVWKMAGAALILVLAWSIGSIIENLETGAFLATLVEGNVPLWLLPVALFILACIMAFATGTSWGTFAIMVPIAASIIGEIHPEWILPAIGAVLAGSVFGDHCSPISDSTILSSVGAECNLMDHVTTQIPYALTAAGASGVGYIAFGLTSNVFIGLAVSVITLVLFLLSVKHRSKPVSA